MDITKTQIGVGIASFAGLAVATSLMVSEPNPVKDYIQSTQIKVEDYIQPIPVEEYVPPAEVPEYIPANPVIDETISTPTVEKKVVKKAKPKQKIVKKAKPKQKITKAQKKSKKVYKSYHKSKKKQRYMTWVELNNLKQTSIYPEGYKAEFSRRD